MGVFVGMAVGAGVGAGGSGVAVGARKAVLVVGEDTGDEDDPQA
jgi:hypothetical protein